MERSTNERVITCPFCNRVNTANVCVNVICSCGAKFYIRTKEWWDRKDGRIVKNWPYELRRKG
jgi:hypothetical protein